MSEENQAALKPNRSEGHITTTIQSPSLEMNRDKALKNKITGLNWGYFSKPQTNDNTNHHKYEVGYCSINHDLPIELQTTEIFLFQNETQTVHVDEITYQTYSGSSIQGRVVCTNYKLIFLPEPDPNANLQTHEGCVNICLGMISRVEKLGRQSSVGDSAYGIEIHCKDLRTIRFIFKQEQHSRRTLFQFIQQHAFASNENDKAFCFYLVNEFNTNGHLIYDHETEFQRQGALKDGTGWRICTSNKDYSVCDTYPATLCIPQAISDEEFRNASNFRSRNRVIALSWYCNKSTASITRCSQPNVGFRGKRSIEDENLIQEIIKANINTTSNPKLFIMDARPRLNAVANQAKGQGFESETNYKNCELIFLDIGNIHVMRDSLKRIRDLCMPYIDESRWFSGVDNTQWLYHVRYCLIGALRIANIIHYEKVSILVHCSDGWDRTSQLCALSQLMLDPYYRTIKGFIVLIEKDWLSFGHKFSQRLGHRDKKFDDEQRSPIFVQFMDCVYQIMQQFPAAFEFNEKFLISVLDHMFANLFGTFLANSEFQRSKLKLKEVTVSLWSYIYDDLNRFENPLYNAKQNEERIFPVVTSRSIRLWTSYYLRWVPHLVQQENVDGVTAELASVCHHLRKHIKDLKGELNTMPLTLSAPSTPKRNPIHT